MDYMNDLGSYEVRPLDEMNNSRVWMINSILGHELKALDVMNS